MQSKMQPKVARHIKFHNFVHSFLVACAVLTIVSIGYFVLMFAPYWLTGKSMGAEALALGFTYVFVVLPITVVWCLAHVLAAIAKKTKIVASPKWKYLYILAVPIPLYILYLTINLIVTPRLNGYIYAKAVDSRDINICKWVNPIGNIGKDNEKDFCRYIVSAITVNSATCPSSASQSGWAEHCHFEIETIQQAVLLKSSTLCESIGFPVTLQSRSGDNGLAECYARVGIATQDSSVCSTMKYSSLQQKERCQERVINSSR